MFKLMDKKIIAILRSKILLIWPCEKVPELLYSTGLHHHTVEFVFTTTGVMVQLISLRQSLHMFSTMKILTDGSRSSSQTMYMYVCIMLQATSLAHFASR